MANYRFHLHAHRPDLDQLRAATASADADRLEELVEEVAGYNAAVAEGLSILVNDYEYEKLATLL